MGNVFLVSSEQGDIGKTTIAIKVSIELSNKGKKVILIDLSKGNKKIAEYLKVNEDIIYDVKDVLDATCSMSQATINISENLSILPFPRTTNKWDNIKRECFTNLIVEAKIKYDAIIIDIDGISSCYYIDFVNIENIVIVNNNDYSVVKEINNAFHIAEKYGLSEIMVIINKYNKKDANKGIMLRINDIKKMIGKDVLAIVEKDIKYMNIDYDFLFSKEKNTFNDTINSIVNEMH